MLPPLVRVQCKVFRTACWALASTTLTYADRLNSLRNAPQLINLSFCLKKQLILFLQGELQSTTPKLAQDDDLTSFTDIRELFIAESTANVKIWTLKIWWSSRRAVYRIWFIHGAASRKDTKSAAADLISPSGHRNRIQNTQQPNWSAGAASRTDYKMSGS